MLTNINQLLTFSSWMNNNHHIYNILLIRFYCWSNLAVTQLLLFQKIRYYLHKITGTVRPHNGRIVICCIRKSGVVVNGTGLHFVGIIILTLIILIVVRGELLIEFNEWPMDFFQWYFSKIKTLKTTEFAQRWASFINVFCVFLIYNVFLFNISDI